MAENIYIYQEKDEDKNVNIKQKTKSITSKVILKQLNFKTIEENQEEADINLKRGSNSYQYNVINDFKQISTNIFFENLMKIGLYRESISDSSRKERIKKYKSSPSRRETSLLIICQT